MLSSEEATALLTGMDLKVRRWEDGRAVRKSR
jgi:hypothetical protein